MWANLWNNINTWFNDITKDFKDFIIANTRNPILWIAIIIIGLLVFEWVYKALHRDYEDLIWI